MNEKLSSGKPEELSKIKALKDEAMNPELIEDLDTQNDRFSNLEIELAAYTEVEAVGRNYTIKINKDDASVLTINLYGKDGPLLLNDLLPDGYNIFEGETATHYKDTLRIITPIELLSKRGGILILLHEIGHAIREEDVEPEVSQKEIDLAVLQGRLHDFLGKSKARLKGKKFLASSLGPLRELPFPDGVHTSVLPKWFKNKYYGAKAESERQAWYYALALAKTLKERGFDILSDFDDVKDLRKFIDLQLASYEYCYEFDKKAHYRKGHREYEPLFVHRNQDEL